MKFLTIAGRVGKDAETRTLQNGDKVTSWTVAVDDGYGDKKSVLWINCSMFGERGAKVAQYIRKGDHIAVAGEPSLRSWTNNSREKQTSLECRVAEVQLMGGKREDRAQSAAGRPSSSAPDLDDSIPF